MKKFIVISLAGAMMLSSCTTTESGAHSGAMFGTILGSAIGGITGGPRGSDIGTIVGMAGGAAVGAAIGNANEKAEQRKYDEYLRQRASRRGQGGTYGARGGSYGAQGGTYDAGGYDGSGQQDGSGFDPNNGGDDRIEMEQDEKTVSLDELQRVGLPAGNASVSFRNVRFIDKDRDGCISPGEECSVQMEIMNNSDLEIFNVTPQVTETTGCKHLFISPSVRVESIKPHNGIRYTATVLAGKRLKSGQVVIRVALADKDGKTMISQDIPIQTKR